MNYCPNCATALPHPPPVTCPSCRAEHYRNAKPCAGALVTNDSRLLLVQRAHEPWLGRWDIPGGFCEEREHPAEAAVREVREETGLTVTVTDLLGMWVDEWKASVTLNIYFLAEVVGGEERPQPGEVERLGWFAPDQLPPPDGMALADHVVDVLDAWRRRQG